MIRIYNGIQRRYRVLHDTSRTRDFMYLTAHWDKKENGEPPRSPQEWAPHPWDPVISADWENKEHERAMEILRAANAQNKKEQPE